MLANMMLKPSKYNEGLNNGMQRFLNYPDELNYDIYEEVGQSAIDSHDNLNSNYNKSSDIYP